MGVGNKYLAVFRAGYEGNEPHHPFLVQLFKNIVQQQEGREALVLLEYFVLGEFEGKEEALALALGGAGFHGVAVEEEHEIVPVDAGAGALQLHVLIPGGAQLLFEILFQQGALVADADYLVRAGNVIVQPLYLRNEVF